MMSSAQSQLPAELLLTPFRYLDDARYSGGSDGVRGFWEKLSARSGALVDRIALRAMEQLFMSSSRPNYRRNIRPQLDRLAAVYAAPELLREPHRFFRPVDQPSMELRRLGRLPGGQRLALSFNSTYQTYDPGYQTRYSAYRGNERNRVHLWLHEGTGRPTVICLHPWCGGVLLLEERVFAAARLYRQGFDVALFTLPFHGGRTPRQARFSGQLFLSRDLRRTNEAMGQTVADLRCLIRDLRARGAGPIGLAGMSMGGYATAMLASLDDELAFVITIVAPCSVADTLWTHGSGRPGRAEAEQAGVTLADLRLIFSVHCPLMRPLRVPRARVLMIRGHGDRIVPDLQQLALWEHWGRPRLFSFFGGHLLQIGRLSYLVEMRRWLYELAL